MKDAVLLSMLFIISGCANPLFTVTERGQIRHVVICWLKPQGNPQAVIDSIETFRTVPGVVDVSVGTKIASDRAVVDSSYDMALIFTFENDEALKSYDTSPQHKQVVDTVLKPNVEKYVVYDSAIQRYEVGRMVEKDVEQYRRDASKKQRDIVDRR